MALRYNVPQEALSQTIKIKLFFPQLTYFSYQFNIVLSYLKDKIPQLKETPLLKSSYRVRRLRALQKKIFIWFYLNIFFIVQIYNWYWAKVLYLRPLSSKTDFVIIVNFIAQMIQEIKNITVYICISFILC